MPLKPEEVRARKFRVALLGYRRRDVDSFLRRVAWDYKSSLEACARPDRASAEAREVERLLRSAQDCMELLRLLAALETKRNHPSAGPYDDALIRFRWVKAAEALSAAADALERAHRVVSRRNEVTWPALGTETETWDVVERSRNGVETTPVTQIALSTPPPPPPSVSRTVHAPG
jgi:DivIVA domain-containing protein